MEAIVVIFMFLTICQERKCISVFQLDFGMSCHYHNVLALLFYMEWIDLTKD